MRIQKDDPASRCRIPFSSIWVISALIVSVIFLFSLGTAFAGESGPNIGLIEAAELRKDPSSWVVLDGRAIDVWAKDHIKGAQTFSWGQYTRTDEKGIPYRIVAPELLSKSLGRLGIDENTSIVVYGDADTSWGGEGWAIWALAWMGHKGKIRLLNGGIQEWKKDKFETEAGDTPGTYNEKKYNFKLRDSIVITTGELKQRGNHLQIIDTRSFVEWVKGHIDGAKRIEWTNFYEGEVRRPLSPEKLKQLLASKGIDTSKPVVYYCTGGVRSAYAWLVHQLSGLQPAMNYEEGMVAWEKK